MFPFMLLQLIWWLLSISIGQ